MTKSFKEQNTSPKKTRRRSQSSHEAILQATVELLEEVGYVRMSIEGIARRAGVGKQTIYRWWSSKAALVMEAYTTVVANKFPLPNTGKVQEDLETIFCPLFKVLNTTTAGVALAGIMTEAQNNPELAQAFRDQFVASRRTTIKKILSSGIKRGELREDIDLECAVDSFYGAMWYRLLLGHAPLDEDFAQILIAQLLQGIQS